MTHGKTGGGRPRLPYAARAQQAALHADRTRFKVIVAHRRFGKTVFAVVELLLGALENGRRAPRYAYVAPFYRQAKAVAWDYLKYYGSRVDGARFHESELRCDLPNGARISLYGADDPDSLRGLYLDGVVLDEYAQMEPRAWSEVIRPALADREGWAVFIGTPMGRNGFWQLYERAKTAPDWRAVLHRAGETGVLPAAELAAARAAMSEAEYAQEFECSFDAAIRGAYYGKLIAAAEADKRIARVAYEPQLPVHTAWDLGVGDATAIWFFQRLRREVRLIDYYESSGVGLDHYARVLQARGYGYGDHLLPHDARVQEMGSGKTRVETLQRGWASARACSATTGSRTASTRCACCCRAAGSTPRDAPAGWRRCATTAANGTSAARPFASGRCTTGRRTRRMPSAIWPWGCGSRRRRRCRGSGTTTGASCRGPHGRLRIKVGGGLCRSPLRSNRGA
jgi:phage terminase large subunit